MTKKYFESIAKRYATIIKNTGYLSLIEIMRILLPFVAVAYIVNIIGKDNYGLVVFCQTIIYYFSVFINWGLDISAVKNVSVNRSNDEKLSEIVSSVLTTKFVLFIIAFLIILTIIYTNKFAYTNRLLFLFAFATCISDVIFCPWFFQGIEKMKYMTITKAVSLIFYASSVFIFIKDKSDYEFIALFQSLGNILAGLISIILLYKIANIKFNKPNFQNVKKTIIDGTQFFISMFSVVLNNTIAKSLSGIFFKMDVVAAFDIAQKISLGAYVPIQMLNQAVYPHIAKTLDKNFVKKFFKFNIGLSLGIAIIFFITAKLTVGLFINGDNSISVTILRILCIRIFFAGISNYLGTPILVSFGHSKQFNISIILSTFLIILLYILLFIFNCFTVNIFAFIMVLTEIFVIVYRMYYCKKYQII